MKCVMKGIKMSSKVTKKSDTKSNEKFRNYSRIKRIYLKFDFRELEVKKKIRRKKIISLMQCSNFNTNKLAKFYVLRLMFYIYF